MKEFFGWGGFTREPEGYMSWQHLLFVTSLMVVMIGLAIWLGVLNRRRPIKKRLGVIAVAAILIDSLELFKIVLFCLRSLCCLKMPPAGVWS